MNASATPAGWPRYLSREEAARYVGVSSSTFDDEVGAGQWPQPRRRGLKGTKATWDRVLLDSFADLDSGLGLQAPPVTGDLMPETVPIPSPNVAEAAALRGVTDAAHRHRTKHRQSKAA